MDDFHAAYDPLVKMNAVSHAFTRYREYLRTLNLPLSKHGPFDQLDSAERVWHNSLAWTPAKHAALAAFIENQGATQ